MIYIGKQNKMAQTSTVNAGIVAGPSQSDNLFLKVFSGEVLKSFNTKTVMKGKHREKTIAAGRTAQFPAIGKASAEYHRPGDRINGQDINAGEKVIAIDDQLIASTFVSDFEEAMNHYETRSEYAVQTGDALAQAFDQHLFAIATASAIAGEDGAVPEQNKASTISVGTAPVVSDIVDAIFEGAATFDRLDVPDSDRCAFVEPSVYWNIIRDGSMLDRDFGNVKASQQMGGGFYVAGIEIVPTNNLALNFGTETLAGVRAGATVSDYTVDGSDSLVLLMQKQALGTVKLMEMQTLKEFQTERLGTLMVSKYACGHGVLRPECLNLIRAV